MERRTDMMMTRQAYRLVGRAAAAALCFAAAGLLSACGRQAAEPSAAMVEAVRGDIRMTVPFHGTLEARHVEQIAVGVQGAAVLVELVEEGAVVEAGDVLARFDSSGIEQDLARHENEWVRARQELESLEKAELPLELLEMEARQADMATETAGEKQFLAATQDLLERGLIAEAEVERQQEKLSALEVKSGQLDMQIKLTKEHVHQARLAKARAALDAAERQKAFTARQLELCVVRAPAAGVVTRLPLTVGGVYRTAAVGDTLYHNQVFLCLPDLSEYVIRGFAAESDMPYIRAGNPVEAVPTAFPGLVLAGRVEQVGRMAQTRPGQPAWKKFFPVQISVEPPGEPLPVGLSVQARVTAGEAADVVLVPREAVFLRDGTTMAARVDAGGAVAAVPVETGLADERYVEIRSGLAAGDKVAAAQP